MSIKAIDSDNEDGVLDNQLAELEKLDAANKAIVSNVVIEANKTSLAEANELLATDSITVVINSLTAIDGHDRQYFFELRSTVVSRRIFIRSQSLIAR